jgi:hypothetical protein
LIPPLGFLQNNDTELEQVVFAQMIYSTGHVIPRGFLQQVTTSPEERGRQGEGKAGAHQGAALEDGEVGEGAQRWRTAMSRKGWRRGRGRGTSLEDGDVREGAVARSRKMAAGLLLPLRG